MYSSNRQEVFYKEVSLKRCKKILQKLQEKTCFGVFFVKLQTQARSFVVDISLWILWNFQDLYSKELSRFNSKYLYLYTQLENFFLQDWLNEAYWLTPTTSSHRKCSIKKLFLKVSQYSQENICVRVSFLTKLQTFSAATLLKRDSNTGVFLWNLWNF